MSLEDIKGTYDAVFSLGDLCLTAIQLKKNHLRPFSGVLDWMASPSLSDVNRLLKNRFVGFMELPNLRFIGYSTGIYSTEKHLSLSDDAYHIISSHDFKASQNTPTHLATYPEVREKFDRRIKRFLEKMETSKRILFVRTEGTFEEVLELESILSKMVKHDFRILIVNHTDVSGLTEKNWPIERVSVVELPNRDIWNANDHFWKMMFDGVQLSGK
ncbi:MAG: peptidase [Bacillales bacterium]|nr:peptidase [Bacillales bacterium]